MEGDDRRLVVADRDVPKKQRHTSRRVWQRLVDEHGADVGESTVRRYVADARRRQPIVLREVMVPQHHPLGQEAEVDFGSVSFYLNGLLTEGWMFVMRLSASGRGFHLDGSAIVARHARAVAKGTEVLVLDHYLEVFKLKPGAFPGATALARARASGAFTATHDEFWATARRRLGDAAGTRVLVDVLLAHRTIPRDALIAGLRAALDIGSLDSEVVVIEARKVSERTVAPIVPIGALARYDRPKPTLDGYDTLLEASS